MGDLDSEIPPLAFAIIGAPRTKNTGQFATQRGRRVIIPSKPYRRWFKAAMQQWPIIRMALRGAALPIRGAVEVTAIWYRDREQGDEDRYKVALGDFLQRSGIVANDYLIHWGGGCRRAIDRARPRTEIQIRVLADGS